MDAAHEQKQSGRGGFLCELWRRVRFYYRCFLVHFLLSLAAVAVLFCLRLGMQSMLTADAMRRYLAASVYDMAPVSGAPSFGGAVLAAAVYLPTGSPDAYFVSEHTASHDGGERMTLLDGGVRNPPSAGREEILPATEGSLYAHPGQAGGSRLAVVPVDLSSAARFDAGNGGILFSNQSGYALDPLSLLSRAYPIEAPALPVSSGGAEAPLVLILHTHGTEAYAPDGAASVEESFRARSEDTEENVVSVGRVLAQTLREQGISVLHCATMFDRESYADSYENAARYIRETLDAHPSILYVFDVHRDALSASDGGILRPVTTVDGEVTAQVMSVVGTDAAGASHAGWRDNLTVAVQLQKRLNDTYFAFARPINLRAATFNAQYAPGSLLFEIGSSGNSVEEARAAAYYLGRELGALILGTP